MPGAAVSTAVLGSPDTPVLSHRWANTSEGEVGVGGQGVRTCGISRDEQGAADPLLELRWAKLLRQVLWNAGDTGVLAILDISAF